MSETDEKQSVPTESPEPAPKGQRACRCGLLLPVLGVAVLVALILYQAGVFTRGKIEPGRTELFPEAATPKGGKPVPVSVRAVPLVYRAAGTVRSRNEVHLTPRIPARITEITVRAGDRVEKGTPLIRLDDSDLRAAVNQAGQRILAAKAAVAAAAERSTTARAGLELAEIEKNRMEELVKTNAVSRQDYDRAVTTYRQAVAGVAQASQGEQAALAETAAMEQALKQAEATLSYATIASPMDGIVAERLADPGDLGNPGAVVLRIFDPKTLWLEVPVRESLVRRIKVGDTIEFEVPAVDGTYNGEVREVVPAVDPGSRTFLARICIGDAPELTPGMFGTMRLELGTEEALLLPAEAVVRTGQLEVVTVQPPEGGSRKQIVRTVPAETPGMLRVTAGLQPGDAVYLEP